LAARPRKCRASIRTAITTRGLRVGAAERNALLPRADIKEGDVVVGLASSGLHSNGYALVRRIVEMSGLAWSARAPFR